MMAERGKGFLLFGGAVLGLLGLSRLLGKARPAGEAWKARAVLQIIDAATGAPVPKGSPALVVEGSSYLARVTVTNRSTVAGAPVAASFVFTISGTAGTQLISFVPPAWKADFGPGASIAWDIVFTVPTGTGGQSGSVKVNVIPNIPAGGVVASVQEPLTIQSAAMVYSAGLSLTVL